MSATRPTSAASSRPTSSAGCRSASSSCHADLSTRLGRNDGADRLAAKPSKRDLERSAAHILEREAAFTMNTSIEVTLPGQQVLDDFAHLRLSTADLSPGEAASRILAW